MNAFPSRGSITYESISMNPDRDGRLLTFLNAFDANKDWLKQFDPQMYYACLDVKDGIKCKKIIEVK